jgi:hypothetical protein
MSNLIGPSTIGEMIAWTAARALEADWGAIPGDDRLADRPPAGEATGSPKPEKRNWLAVVHAAISEPIGAAWPIGDRAAGIAGPAPAPDLTSRRP